MDAYNKLLLVVIQDIANRLAYLGFHGDNLIETLTLILSEDTLDFYNSTCDTSDAAGFDPFVDRKDWTGGGLPHPRFLPRVHEALEAFIDRLFPEGRLCTLPPFPGGVKRK